MKNAIFSDKEMQLFIGFIEHFPTVKALYLAKVRSFNFMQERLNRLGIHQRLGTGTRPFTVW